MKLARLAMATRFELVLHGGDETALRAAGEEALEEIERLDRRLSLYRPESEIARVNARAAREPVPVSPEVLALLQHAISLSAETGGAFDITLGPLIKCWGFMAREGKVPGAAELEECRAQTGAHRVELDSRSGTVRFERPGVMLDLGAIGKGYAVGKAAEVLRLAGITSALIHGGTSTVYAVGCPPDAESWKVAVEMPVENAAPGSPREGSALYLAFLRDEALSVSAVWGKHFTADGRTFGHVLDPRSGHPVERALLAAVVLPSATETDALSTALLVAGEEGFNTLSRLRLQMKSLLVVEQEGRRRALSNGFAGPASQ